MKLTDRVARGLLTVIRLWEQHEEQATASLEELPCIISRKESHMKKMVVRKAQQTKLTTIVWH